ncbi:hypothetical protein E2C01_021124 [Portunus trituberculatus]|uniref:RNA-directed DNA polymerase from mobile element jockey n=1 Tax=Portunus trituberculatus TaxID=210409 RepID=A0A5B7E580_PORTR|nr:hypothetical protein [Portunus trituberculatus]
MTINHTKTVEMQDCTSSAAVPFPPTLPRSSSPPSGSVGQAAQVRSAAYRLYMLARLKSLGTPTDELKGIYITFILPRLMYTSPVWSFSLTYTQQQQLEDVQKRACKIILGPDYTNYDHALTILSLPRLAAIHREAPVKLARGLLRHPRLRHLLLPNAPNQPTP